MKSLFILADGTEIFSGIGKQPAIQSVKYTRSFCAGDRLDYESACAAMVEATLIDAGGFSFTAGEPLEYWLVDSEGHRRLVGRFLMESPQRPSPDVCRFTAYDRMILTDVDLSGWLASLEDWPYTVNGLLEAVCQKCGLTLAADTVLCNGDFPVQKFLWSDVTGRQLLKWIASANAACAYITAQGELAFGRFDEGTAQGSVMALELADYATAPIERVVVRQSADDVGVAFPENSTGETYAVMNPLLGAFQSQDLLTVAENIAQGVVGLSYTPGKVHIYDPEAALEPGRFYTVTDRNGRTSRTAAFSAVYSGGITTLQSQGSQSRESATALAARDTAKVVQGRVTELKASLEEVSASLERTAITAESVQREQAALAVQVDGISSRVSAAEEAADSLRTRYSAVEQKADSLSLRIVSAESELSEKADREQLAEVTEHFLFTEDGLTIRNSGTGMGISVSEQRIEFTGGTDPTTAVTPNEMTTTNLSVGSRLDLGAFSYIPRTNGNLSLRYTGGNAT